MTFRQHQCTPRGEPLLDKPAAYETVMTETLEEAIREFFSRRTEMAVARFDRDEDWWAFEDQLSVRHQRAQGQAALAGGAVPVWIPQMVVPEGTGWRAVLVAGAVVPTQQQLPPPPKILNGRS